MNLDAYTIGTPLNLVPSMPPAKVTMNCVTETHPLPERESLSKEYLEKKFSFNGASYRTVSPEELQEAMAFDFKYHTDLHQRILEGTAFVEDLNKPQLYRYNSWRKKKGLSPICRTYEEPELQAPEMGPETYQAPLEIINPTNQPFVAPARNPDGSLYYAEDPSLMQKGRDLISDGMAKLAQVGRAPPAKFYIPVEEVESDPAEEEHPLETVMREYGLYNDASAYTGPSCYISAADQIRARLEREQQVRDGLSVDATPYSTDELLQRYSRPRPPTAAEILDAAPTRPPMMEETNQVIQVPVVQPWIPNPGEENEVPEPGEMFPKPEILRFKKRIRKPSPPERKEAGLLAKFVRGLGTYRKKSTFVNRGPGGYKRAEFPEDLTSPLPLICLFLECERLWCHAIDVQSRNAVEPTAARSRVYRERFRAASRKAAEFLERCQLWATPIGLCEAQAYCAWLQALAATETDASDALPACLAALQALRNLSQVVRLESTGTVEIATKVNDMERCYRELQFRQGSDDLTPPGIVAVDLREIRGEAVVWRGISICVPTVGPSVEPLLDRVRSPTVDVSCLLELSANDNLPWRQWLGLAEPDRDVGPFVKLLPSCRQSDYMQTKSTVEAWQVEWREHHLASDFADGVNAPLRAWGAFSRDLLLASELESLLLASCIWFQRLRTTRFNVNATSKLKPESQIRRCDLALKHVRRLKGPVECGEAVVVSGNEGVVSWELSKLEEALVATKGLATALSIAAGKVGRRLEARAFLAEMRMPFPSAALDLNCALLTRVGIFRQRLVADCITAFGDLKSVVDSDLTYLKTESTEAESVAMSDEEDPCPTPTETAPTETEGTSYYSRVKSFLWG